MLAWEMLISLPVKELWAFWRDIKAKSLRQVDIALIGWPSDSRDRCRDTLLFDSSYSGRLKVLDLDRPGGSNVEFTLLLIEDADLPSLNAMPGLLPHGRGLVVLAGVSGDSEPAVIREVARKLALPTNIIVPIKTATDLGGSVAQELCSRFHDLVIPLARQFPVFRTVAARQEIHATAKQNAFVGAVPVPGGDMLLMTANQIKMVMRLAAIYDLPFGKDRLREILAVVGGGLGMRSLARQLLKFLPGPGWLLSGGLGFGGTIAIGEVALAHLRRSSPETGQMAPRTGDRP